MSAIYVAVDTPDLERALEIAGAVRGEAGGVKLGLEFFAAQGPAGVRRVSGQADLAKQLRPRAHVEPVSIAILIDRHAVDILHDDERHVIVGDAGIEALLAGPRRLEIFTDLPPCV